MTLKKKYAVNFILFYFIYLFNFTYFWPEACGILVPQPGTEPRATAVNALSPNHWTARELPRSVTFKELKSIRQKLNTAINVYLHSN